MFFLKKRIKLFGIILFFLGILLILSPLVFPRIKTLISSQDLSFSKWNSTKTSIEDYGENLIPEKIIIPVLDLNLGLAGQKIINKDWPVASDSANYLHGSGLLDQKGNIVIYGHNFPGIFASLYNLKISQNIFLQNQEGKLFWYEIKDIKTVDPSDLSVIQPLKNQEILTIYTCSGWFDEARFVVIAQRVNREVGIVKKVIDGDSIELEDGNQVRYIGIDSPEMTSEDKKIFSSALLAKKENEKLVKGKVVFLVPDVSDVDNYNRLLRYVYVFDILTKEKVFVNEYLVENGFAKVLTIGPDIKYSDMFIKAENIARKEKRGLWKVSNINF